MNMTKSADRNFTENTLYSNEQTVDLLYQVALNRLLDQKEILAISKKIDDGEISSKDLLISIILSPEFCQILGQEAPRFHLYFIHNTRIKLIKFILPKADIILDIGGANGSLIEYGYEYSFQKMIVTDIPPDSRIDELKQIDLEKKWSLHSKIEVLLTSMTDLSAIESDSIDLVWAGQVVEHISESELKKSLEEIYRVLKIGGKFCFDTPNALMARIHSPNYLLHPEHKKEYTPKEMRNLISGHFCIEKELGLLPMPISYKNNDFSYIELIMNNSFSDSLDYSYIMYFECQKR